MQQPTPVHQIKFSGDPDLLARVRVLLQSDPAQRVLRTCKPHIVTGLPGSVSEQALFHYLAANNCVVGDNYHVYVSHRARTVTEHKNRGRAEGVEVPAHVVTNLQYFRTEVLYRIQTVVGSRAGN